MWNRITPISIPMIENTQSSISARPRFVEYCINSSAAGKRMYMIILKTKFNLRRATRIMYPKGIPRQISSAAYEIKS